MTPSSSRAPGPPGGSAPPKHGDAPARATWRTEPADRTAEWFAGLDALRRSGRVGRNGVSGPLAFGPYFTEYAGVIRLAGPQPVVRGALALLGAIGRLRGYLPGAAESSFRAAPSGSRAA